VTGQAFLAPARAEELIARHFTLIDAAEMSSMADLYDPDTVYRRPGYPVFHGREEVLRFYTEIRQIRDGRHALDTVVASGDRIAVDGEFRGVLYSGARLEVRFSDFFVLGAHSRFTRRETYFSVPPS
jgi:steroid delta-isomerase